MSGLAELFLAKGHWVEGSDVTTSDSVERLLQKGIPVHIGHETQSFLNFQPDVVVVSSAISKTNPILLLAQKMGCKVLKRGELLAECVNEKDGLVVAGSHGKTSTSSMLAFLLKKVGIEASFTIGGRLSDTGDNAGLGTSPFFVAEGDESDASFLKLKPKVLGVTNLDADHMMTYGHSFDALVNHFADWVLGLPPSGTAVLNSDDVGTLAVLKAMEVKAPHFWNTRKLVMVGKTLPLEWEAKVFRFIELKEVVQQENQIQFQMGGSTLSLPLIGEFNVRNALMAVAMAHSIGVNEKESLTALKNYPGVLRRMQLLGEFQGVPIFEDYGHHPTEILASIGGLKAAYPKRRLIQVFQLHRYTRTRDLWDDFLFVLSRADHVLLFPIYPASEAKIPNITAQRLAEALQQKNQHKVSYVDSVESAFQVLNTLLEPLDLLLLQGAGDLPQELGKALFEFSTTSL